MLVFCVVFMNVRFSGCWKCVLLIFNGLLVLWNGLDSCRCDLVCLNIGSMLF